MKKFDALKLKAEELLRNQAEDPLPSPMQGGYEMIQQLRVYQVELEMQNEELRRSQESLEKSRDHLFQLYHKAPVGYASIDRNGMIVEVNMQLATMLRRTVDDLKNKALLNFIDSADRDVFLGRFRAFYKAPEGKKMEIRMIRSDNSRFYALFEGRTTTLTPKAQSDVVILVIVSDISARKEAEANLMLADKVIQTAQESIMITDPQGKIVNVNPRFEEITGYLRAEVVGKNPNLLQSSRHDSKFYGQMWSELQETGKWRGILWNKRKNGELYAERLTISVIYGERKEVTHYVGVFTDITEQIELERQLRESQKMEAIGTLVGGIAHEFNNALYGITGNLYLAKQRAESLPNVIERLEIAEKLSFRSADMVSQLMAFARKSILQMEKLSFTHFIQELSKAHVLDLPGSITVNCEITEEELHIVGDRPQLRQLFMSLIRNAQDAVAESSEPSITITLQPSKINEAFLEKHPQITEQHFAHLSVWDNGHGIPQKIQEHIFEPFFTTREVGKGTGLGLAMVYGAVQTHKGVIEVHSEADHGCIIHVYFPLSR